MRRLSTSIFVLSLTVWLASLAVFVIEMYRADAVAIVLPGHHCLFLYSWEHLMSAAWISNWPPAAGTKWYSAPTREAMTVEGPFDSDGPFEFMHLATGVNLHHGDFSVMTEDVDLCVSGDGTPRDLWRNDDRWGGLQQVHVIEWTFPRWSLPVLFALPFIIWISTAGRRRYRAYSRRRRGLCICCGYDLRQTPSRCPECGAQVVNKHPSAVTPI